MADFTTNSLNSNAIIYTLTSAQYCRSTGFTFLCMLAGDATMTYKSTHYTLSDKTVLLLHPNDTYHLQSDTIAVLLEVSFDFMFFSETFQGDIDQLQCNSLLMPDHDYTNLRTHLANIATIHYSDVQENRFYLLSNVYQLFHCLYVEYHNTHANETFTLSKQQQKINKMTTYLDKNYSKSLALQDLAAYMNFTPQYVEKLMKSAHGCTFYTYLNRLRLSYAEKLLQFTDLSVAQIASACGFPNLASFVNLFLTQQACSPEEFRQQYLESLPAVDSKRGTLANASLAKDFLANNILIQVTNHTLIEKSNKSAAEVSVLKNKLIHPVWKDLINLGSCNNFESPTFRKHLDIVQSELAFSYGRIEGILDSIYAYTHNNTVTYNFSKAYRIIDFLQTVHMYPHFELGNKSPTIYKDYQESIPDQPSRKENIHLFNHTLSMFLMNCINRYGFQEVSKWRFELWMSYNDFLTIVENPADYAERFIMVYEVIKKHLPDAKIGGPGFNTFLPISNFDLLLKELTKRNIRPDFISFYLYPYIRPQGSRYNKDGDLIILLSKDKDHFKKNIDQIKLLTEKYFESTIDLYVTEYSSVIFSHNYINDSPYQAAFIVKETLDHFSSVKSFSYWLLSDVSIEYEDAVDILFGGNGLISRNGIKKPSYHALSFLGNLGNHLITKDTHYIITASSNTKFQILAFHYCYFNKDYCDDQEKFKFLRFPTSAFESLPPLDLTIHLKDLIAGSYIIRQYTIDQEHGNIMHTWLKLNSPHDLTMKDIDYLRGFSIPEFRIYQKEIQDALELQYHLNSNDVVMTEIELILK